MSRGLACARAVSASNARLTPMRLKGRARMEAGPGGGRRQWALLGTTPGAGESSRQYAGILVETCSAKSPCRKKWKKCAAAWFGAIRLDILVEREKWLGGARRSS